MGQRINLISLSFVANLSNSIQFDVMFIHDCKNRGFAIIRSTEKKIGQERLFRILFCLDVIWNVFTKKMAVL
jgi:hypothetical protein